MHETLIKLFQQIKIKQFLCVYININDILKNLRNNSKEQHANKLNLRLFSNLNSLFSDTFPRVLFL